MVYVDVRMRSLVYNPVEALYNMLGDPIGGPTSMIYEEQHSVSLIGIDIWMALKFSDLSDRKIEIQIKPSQSYH